MKRNRSFQKRVFVVLIGICSFIGMAEGIGMAQPCPSDISPPTITITPPGILVDGVFKTSSPTVNLSGEADDDVGITSIFWKSESGGTVLGSGTAHSSTDWTGPWDWKVDGIPISPVEGQITFVTMTAADMACNERSATLSVKYSVAPPPTISKNIDLVKTKFTFYFSSGSGTAASEPAYNRIDRFSTVGYLQIMAGETFTMPFDKDVRITADVPDPRPNHSGEKLRIFTQTIPAGTVTGTAKYRYVHPGGGIYEFLLQPYYATSCYMYLFVDQVDFLTDIKKSMTPDQYWQLTRSISNFILTIWIGDTAWEGSSKLVPGTYTYHKQELVYNR
jgi:hypothetical protein